MSEDPKHLTEAFVAIGYWCDDPDGTDEDLRGILREAIREAQASARDDALEEAAVAADRLAEAAHFPDLPKAAALAIRKLKSKG